MEESSLSFEISWGLPLLSSSSTDTRSPLNSFVQYFIVGRRWRAFTVNSFQFFENVLHIFLSAQKNWWRFGIRCQGSQFSSLVNKRENDWLKCVFHFYICISRMHQNLDIRMSWPIDFMGLQGLKLMPSNFQIRIRKKSASGRVLIERTTYFELPHNGAILCFIRVNNVSKLKKLNFSLS